MKCDDPFDVMPITTSFFHLTCTGMRATKIDVFPIVQSASSVHDRSQQAPLRISAMLSTLFPFLQHCKEVNC